MTADAARPADLRIDIDPPLGWKFEEKITLLRDPVDGDLPLANVIASSELVPPEIDAEYYARKMSAQLQQECPAYRELQFEEMDVFGGRNGWLRRFEWEPERGDPVTQLQIYYADDGRAFMATATAKSADFEKCRAELAHVLYSLRLRPGAPQ
ncbi:MAG TPA: DcrB-related protein [Solirubrobacterales bacterium]